MQLSVSETRSYFLRDGRPFFYLADTVWAAFSNAPMDEWRAYLAYRRRQGFTALQISVLPILHDMSASGLDAHPFAVDERGQWDFNAPSPAYFARAAEMVGVAREEGFVPALVLLWCNYVPDTWGSQRTPDVVMPAGAVAPYVEYVVRLLAPYDPVYIISGDTDFPSERAIGHYTTALRVVKDLSPHALTTLHLAPQADLPDDLAHSPHLDFYMYQSGHHVEEQDRAYTLAQRFAGKPVRHPVVNGEPCYEGHGHGHRYGRFSAFDVRRAIWQSLLAGAGAGVTYGAHGVWSWHRRGVAFTSEAFSMRPFDWREALRLEGAWDASFARAVVERYDLYGLDARPDAQDVSPEIRVAAAPDRGRVAVYVPYPTEVAMELDVADDYIWTVIDLAARHWGDLPVSRSTGRVVIPMHEANNDILVIGTAGGSV